ncbi:MAG: hypothetical protein IKC83_01030 [Clostridia bacterium]|nr:hypothetical protein [Clostridia bacterium]
MKVKTLRSIIQAGMILSITLLLSLAIVLIVQFVEIKNAEEKLDELTGSSGSYSISIRQDDTL